MQSEEILDLGAGDQHRDAVGKPDHHRPGNKLHRRAHAGRAQHDEYRARHYRTHVQAIDAVRSDDSSDHDDKRAGRTADLSFRIRRERRSESR